MDLEEVRWKLAEELNPDEVSFLIDNKDKLNEEELDAFKDRFALAEGGEPEETGEEAGKEEEAAEGEKEEAGEKEEEEKPQFLTKAEAEEFVQKALADRDAAKKDADTGTKEEKDAKKELLKLFDEGYKPKDPNEFANKLLEVVTPILTQKTIENISQLTQAQRQQFDDANARLDKEYTDLAKKNGLPDLTTKEGQQKNAEIAAVAAQYAMDNYYDAYELYAKLPAKFGGGLSEAAAEKAAKKEALNKQKAAASLIGKGSGEGGVKDKSAGPSREDIATNSMDTLLERAMS